MSGVRERKFCSVTQSSRDRSKEEIKKKKKTLNRLLFLELNIENRLEENAWAILPGLWTVNRLFRPVDAWLDRGDSRLYNAVFSRNECRREIPRGAVVERIRRGRDDRIDRARYDKRVGKERDCAEETRCFQRTMNTTRGVAHTVDSNEQAENSVH